ncbi:MAG: 4Fe-4S dicluster domain-containing protein [Chloroflexi bacterium]|nr:4Fe-4S dicluster domain-containing protein [Chloroflexota bacterium]MBI2934974.1 4Fe-4S dicluster domain-containing protein [Chloroflexota bacterium]
MAKYAMFWGCQIPARLPFVEKSVRLVFDRLGMPFAEIPGFTCCPEKEMFLTTDEHLWLLAATRNLALVEREGLDILSPCNGCWNTFRTAIVTLQSRPDLKADVNRQLAEIGLEYKGQIKAKHFLQFCYEELGTTRIRSLVEAPLTGMRLATHNGCHLVRPSSVLDFDDPLQPTKFDALVEALGAKSVDYKTKMACCGQSFNAADQPEMSTTQAFEKLSELQKLGVDALTTNCPACFIQYDFRQVVMRRRGDAIQMPVLYYSELLGLAMGIDRAELGLDQHKTEVAPFFEIWEKRKKKRVALEEIFDLPALRKCHECGACVNDCPVVKLQPHWNPNTLIGRVLAGELDEVMASQDIWQCIDCYLCLELCPQKFGMRQFFETMKQLAMEREGSPDGLRNAINAFMRTGRLIEPSEMQRRKLGLPAGSNADCQDFLDLIESLKHR